MGRFLFLFFNQSFKLLVLSDFNQISRIIIMLKTVLHHFHFLVFPRCVLFRLTSNWKFFAESPYAHSTSSHILTSFLIHFYFYNIHTPPSISIIHTSPSPQEGKSVAQTPQESHSHFPTPFNPLIPLIPTSIF